MAIFCVSRGRGGLRHLRHFPRFVVGKGEEWMGYLLKRRGTGRRNVYLQQLDFCYTQTQAWNN